MDKYDRVKPVRWHMIGTCNGTRPYIVDKVDLIHSVDSKAGEGN